MKTNICLFILCICFLKINSQNAPWNDVQKIEWLKKHAINISSDLPTDKDRNDLKPLNDVLKDVNIVMLGEEAHGEGNVISAKIKLIKYLHEQLGFDVLAFEAGFYSINKACSDIKNDMVIDSVLNNGVLGPWSEMNEFSPLITYISSNKKSKAPFSLYGFDCQFSNTYSNTITKDIESTFTGISELSDAEKHSFYSSIYRTAGTGQPNPFKTAQDSANYFKQIDLYIKLSDELTDKELSQYWKQFFKSLKGNSEFVLCYAKYLNSENKPWETIAGLRDEQMADNLIWIIEHNPNKKIIVWAASNHLSRNLKTLKEVSDTAFYAHYKPAGEYIKDRYKNKAYFLGFSAAKGSYYAKGLMNAPKLINESKNNSIECFMDRAGFNYGILNFQKLPPNNFLLDEMYSNPFGHASILGVWPEIMDGLFFIDEIVPPTFKN
jgi:erythromycin esterase